jgi:hypothetical protein
MAKFSWLAASKLFAQGVLLIPLADSLHLASWLTVLGEIPISDIERARADG